VHGTGGDRDVATLARIDQLWCRHRCSVGGAGLASVAGAPAPDAAVGRKPADVRRAYRYFRESSRIGYDRRVSSRPICRCEALGSGRIGLAVRPRWDEEEENRDEEVPHGCVSDGYGHRAGHRLIAGVLALAYLRNVETERFPRVVQPFSRRASV